MSCELGIGVVGGGIEAMGVLVAGVGSSWRIGGQRQAGCCLRPNVISLRTLSQLSVRGPSSLEV